MALAHWILGKFLGVGCHCFPPPLDVPTFSVRCLHVQRRERPLAEEGGILLWREMFRKISSRIRLPRNSRDLLHAANLRHGTDSFTFPPKEGVLTISSPVKIRRLRPGLNPRTWIPKASTLPLDHRNRLKNHYSDIIKKKHGKYKVECNVCKSVHHHTSNWINQPNEAKLLKFITCRLNAV